jgi:hypothetical protein
MSRFHRARLVVVLILFLAAVSGALPARAETPETGREEPVAVWTQFVDLLASLWQTAGTAVRETSFAEEGCRIDPHGGCGSQPVIEADAGCRIDPHGGCSH